MKKTLIALAILAASSASMAQVTLFGVVDATIAVGNGDVSNKTRLANSGYNSSRLGFRGVEELGGGLKASFHLEAGVNNDDGTGSASSDNNQAAVSTTIARTQGLTFNRKSVVSLSGGFGEVRFGRDYTPQFWNQTVYDPFGTNGVGTTRTLVGGGGGQVTVRASNSMAYLTPAMGGFGVWLQTYLGENASTAAAQAGDGSALRLSYDQGPLSAAFAYSDTTTGVGTNGQSTNAGASFNFGAATVMALYTKETNTGAKDVTGYLLGGLIPVGAGTIRVAFSNSDNNTSKVDQFALGYVHDLSKRTALYATYATVNNSGGGSAALNGAVTKANASSSGYDFGVRHSF
jgi:predicted porin